MESGQESGPGRLAQSSCAFLHQPLWGGWLLNPDHFSCSFGGSAMSQIWGVRLSRGVKNRVPLHIILLQLFSSVQSLSRVQLFATPWTAARQASLSITNSRSLPKFMSHRVSDAIQPSIESDSPQITQRNRQNPKAWVLNHGRSSLSSEEPGFHLSWDFNMSAASLCPLLCPASYVWPAEPA